MENNKGPSIQTNSRIDTSESDRLPQNFKDISYDDYE